MVLNLDKCIGCQTCTVTCKNVWTTRQGIEYGWFNNVETKPGTGYPTEWENQDRYKGGWELNRGKLRLRQGGKIKELLGLFNNLNLPSLGDYYEPFTFDFSSLKRGRFTTPPSARPYSMVTGRKMEKIKKGPNWEDDLSGTWEERSADPDLKNVDTEGMHEFEHTFMMWLPRLCEHCLNPACVASCPSGAIYKRDEDGIVLIDEHRCRGWRECVSACPYKKIYFNWQRKRSEKCIFCYPRIENGAPTVCSHSCVGRIRYVGVVLYDQDKIEQYASVQDPRKLYETQLGIFLDPHDDSVIQEAEKQGISHEFIVSAQQSPVYKMMCEWKIAFPLHPEWRTLPMQWYIPPLSPMKAKVQDSETDVIPDIDNMRIPVAYLANLLTAGYEKPVREALEKMLALRLYMRSLSLKEDKTPDVVGQLCADLTQEQMDEMYRYLAIASYDDRFVIPSMRYDNDKHPFDTRSHIGYPRDPECTQPYNYFGGM